MLCRGNIRGKNEWEERVSVDIRLAFIIKHISQTFGVLIFPIFAMAKLLLQQFHAGEICFVVVSMQLFLVNAPKFWPKHGNIYHMYVHADRDRASVNEIKWSEKGCRKKEAGQWIQATNGHRITEIKYKTHTKSIYNKMKLVVSPNRIVHNNNKKTRPKYIKTQLTQTTEKGEFLFCKIMYVMRQSQHIAQFQKCLASPKQVIVERGTWSIVCIIVTFITFTFNIRIHIPLSDSSHSFTQVAESFFALWDMSQFIKFKCVYHFCRIKNTFSTKSNELESETDNNLTGTFSLSTCEWMCVSSSFFLLSK